MKIDNSKTILSLLATNNTLEEKPLQLHWHQKKQSRSGSKVHDTKATPSPSPVLSNCATTQHDENDDNDYEDKERCDVDSHKRKVFLYPSSSTEKHKCGTISTVRDFIKKQNLSQKEQDVEIQKELKAKVVLPTRAESIKPVELRDSKKDGNHDQSTHATKRPAKKEKLLCICRTPYDNTKFYVGCEHCSNWFHGDCVGVTEEMTKTMEEYECPDCQRAADPQELYCLCKQPYDKSQFYVGCEYCSNWFHGDCVGVTEEMCKTMEEYVCSECRNTTDTPLLPQTSDCGQDDSPINIGPMDCVPE